MLKAYATLPRKLSAISAIAAPNNNAQMNVNDALKRCNIMRASKLPPRRIDAPRERLSCRPQPHMQAMRLESPFLKH
jgi:hypothetical protein